MDLIITYYKIIIMGLFFLTPSIIALFLLLRKQSKLEKQNKEQEKKLKEMGLK